jgi:hypothetical protein
MCLRISLKENGQLESQEKDSWTMLKMIKRKWVVVAGQNTYVYRRLETDSEGNQGPAWTVRLVQK